MLGDLSLVSVSRYLQLITFRWAGWLRFDRYPTFSWSFLFLCWIHNLCAVIHAGLQRWESVLILFLVFFYIDKNKKSDRQDKLPVTTFFPSIVLYGNTIRRSTSEHFPIKGCSLHFSDRVIKCHNTRGDMSAMPLISQHSNNNIHGMASTLIHMCQLTPNCLRAKYARTI